VDLQYRRLAQSDSIPEITALLHRAYRPLLESGLRYLATHQGDDTTKERLASGDAFVVTQGRRIVGTVTVRRSCTDHEWYMRPEVASMQQLAVDPDLQSRGIGNALMQLAEDVAREWGKTEMALDTSDQAKHLIAIYMKRGYRVVSEITRDIVNYRSIVLSKTL
jgi:ribosomal protein S18 acetylase RimI-like enzyme